MGVGSRVTEGKTSKGTRLPLTSDELHALDDALSFVEGARWEDENTADFRAVVRKVRRATEQEG